MFISVDQAFDKLKKYCAYQERSQAEVRQKLMKEGIRGDDAENIIVGLIGEGFLNEERFAKTFARGKFRIKKWGRLKIQAGLKAKGVSEQCIRKGLSEISESDYLSTLKSLLSALPGSKKKATATERSQAFRTLRTRGFESALISRLLGTESDDVEF